MAKQLLLTVLTDTLGHYVEGLSLENLKLGVWSGKVEFNNLKLRDGVLDSLNLPVCITRGSCKSLKLKVPWRNIETKPVNVVIDGVYIQAGPLNMSAFSPENISKQALANKRGKLQQAEDALLNDIGISSEETKATYVQQMTAKVLDNLEITLTNVHIRYEDDTAVESQTFAAGITIDTISLATTDSAWNETFVQRKPGSIAAIHKLGHMENLTIYWNVASGSLSVLDKSSWEAVMESLIYVSRPRPTLDKKIHSRLSESTKKLTYIRPPPNSFALRFTHTERSSDTVPKISLDVDSPDMKLSLEQRQYEQMMALSRSFSQLDRIRLISLHRPRRRPTDDPRSWWKYAFSLVSGRYISAHSKMDLMHRCMSLKDRYILLLKRVHSGGSTATTVPAGSAQVIEAEMVEIEEALPLHTLIVFRQLAALEIKTDSALREIAAAEKQKRSFWSRGVSTFSKLVHPKSSKSKISTYAPTSPFGSSLSSHVGSSSRFDSTEEDDDDDEQLMASIRGVFTVPSTDSLVGQDHLMLRMRIQCNAEVNVSSNWSPVARLQLAVIAALEMKAASRTITFSLNDFSLADECTPGALSRHIFVSQTRPGHSSSLLDSSSISFSPLNSSPLNSSGIRKPAQSMEPSTLPRGKSVRSQCSIVFESRGTESSVQIKCAPLEITWNEYCVQKLLDIFVSKKSTSTSSNRLISSDQLNRFATVVALPSLNTLTLNIEIDAPKFVIPDDCSRDYGCLLLDTGIFQMRGQLAPEGLGLSVSLTAVNIGMPTAIGSRFGTGVYGENNLYLVKPFNVTVGVQNHDKSEADMSISISVTPITAELDASKMIRILRVMNLASRTASNTFGNSPNSQDLNEDDDDDDHDHRGHILKLPVHGISHGRRVDLSSSVQVTSSSVSLEAMPPTHRLVQLTIACAALSLKLRLHESHNIVLSIRSLETHVFKRLYDLMVTFNLRSISLNDSLRAESQKALIWTPLSTAEGEGGGGDHKLIRLDCNIISNNKSPLYDGHALQIQFDFAKLALSIDAATISRLQPFIKSLFEGFALVNEEARTLAARNTLSTTSSSPFGARVSVSMPSISATATTYSPSSSAYIPALSGIRVNCQVASVALVLMRSDVVRRDTSGDRDDMDIPARYLEPAYRVEAGGFSVVADVKKTTSALILLDSFSVTDQRPESAGYVHNELLYRSNLASEYSSSTATSASKRMDRSRSSSSNSLSSLLLVNPTQKLKEECILSVDYREGEGNQKTVKITLRDITSFLAADSVMDLADICMKNATAANELLASMKVDSAELMSRYSYSSHRYHGASVETEEGAIREDGPGCVTTLGTGSTMPSSSSSHAHAAAALTSLMGVSISVINPRLILLEDPEKTYSRAVVARCGIFLSFVADVADQRIMDTKETLHVSFHSAEVFVLAGGIHSGIPQQIIEPTGVEFHMNRRLVRALLLSCEISLELDTISSRVSLNDLILAQKILSRAQLSLAVKSQQAKPADVSSSSSASPWVASSVANARRRTSMKPSAGAGARVGASSASCGSSAEAISKPFYQATVYDIIVRVRAITLVGINDYNRHTQPVLRFLLGETMFRAQGAPSCGELFGDGNLLVSVEYFNVPVATWEPVVEAWRPDISLKYNNQNGLVLNLENSSTLQLNVSGSMSSQLLRVLRLVTLIGKGEVTERKEEHAVVLCNHLAVPLIITDSLTRQQLLCLDDNTPTPLPLQISEESARFCVTSTVLPTAFDLRVIGPLQHERLPIVSLPLNCSKPRPYYLQPVGGQATSRGFQSEPIVEEVYENERYQPLKMTWGKPWKSLGDPKQWSSASGEGMGDPTLAQLPSERWEWLEQAWAVDMTGTVGVEIDEHGWEYGNTFGALMACHTRRAHKALDVARRRRWVRTRVHKAQAGDDSSRPLVVFWDVKVNSNGSRIINIRSGLEIKNSMPFPIMISLRDINCTGTHEFGPIEEGRSMPAPLLSSHAAFVRIKRADVDYTWSQEFDCRMHAGGRGSGVTVKDVHCVGDGEAHELPDLYMQIAILYSDKALVLSCLPYIVMHNHLPCNLLYRCTSSRGLPTEHIGTLPPGKAAKLTEISKTMNPLVTVQIGSFLWSSAVDLLHTSTARRTLDLYHPEGDQDCGINLSITTKPVDAIDGGQFMEVHVYSRYMLVDQTDLELSVRTKRMIGARADSLVEVTDSQQSDGSALQEFRKDVALNTGPTRLLERRAYGEVSYGDTERSWAHGSNGVALFQSDDNKMSIGIKRGAAWSGQVSMVSIGTSKTPIEILDQTTKCKYQLAYSVSRLPGIFRASQVVRVMASITIVNTLPETVSLRQTGQLFGPPPEKIPVFTRSEKVVSIQPRTCGAWHKVDDTMGTTLQLKITSSEWSIGSIDINDVGSSVLAVPRSDLCLEGHGSITIHIDVKLSDEMDDSYLTVVIWFAEPDSDGDYNTAALSLRNDTDVPITVQQDNVDFRGSRIDPRMFELCVPPGQWLPFGWIDPAAGTIVKVVVSTTLTDQAVRPASLDTLKVGSKILLDTLQFDSSTGAGGTDSVELTVVAAAGGKLLRATRRTKALKDAQDSGSDVRHKDSGSDSSRLAPLASRDNRRDISVNLNFHSIGISIIAESPVRREFMSLYVEGFEASVCRHLEESVETGSMKKHIQEVMEPTETMFLNLKIMDFQVDNFSETAVFPVLLHSFNSSERKKANRKKERENRLRAQQQQQILCFGGGGADLENSDSKTHNQDQRQQDKGSDIHFLLLSAARLVPPGSTTAIYKYVALRILEIKLEVDSSTLQLYFSDLHGDLVGETTEQTLAKDDPEKWIDSFNAKTIARAGEHVHLVNMEQAKAVALSNKMYIEALVIHPIKISVSYIHTSFPRNRAEDVFSSPEYRWLKVIRSVVSLDDFQVRMKSFIVIDATESSVSLRSRLINLYVDDLKKHLVQIAGQLFGSMKMLGKPVGLYKNIGGGVKDFFYEPYQGMMHSPQSFVAGVGRGTGSLLTHVATGVLSSTAAVVESATQGLAKGAALLSGDVEFTRERNEKRRINQASTGGIISGLKAGGESVMSGFSSGIGGLVMKPVEEGRKGGAIGFAKGVGLGFRGAIVKPVLGITDGIANVAHGFRNQMADMIVVAKARPARALSRSAVDFAELVLGTMDTSAARAQEYIVNRARKLGEADAFVASVHIGSSHRGALGTALVSFSGPLAAGKPKVTDGKLIVTTEKYVYKLQINETKKYGFETIWKIAYSDISHCTFVREYNSVELRVYREGYASLGPTIACCSHPVALQLYSTLWCVSFRMGSPASMVPPERLVVAHSGKGIAGTLTSAPVLSRSREDGWDGLCSGSKIVVVDCASGEQGRATGHGGVGAHGSQAVSTVLQETAVMINTGASQSNFAMDSYSGLDGYLFGSANHMTFPPVVLPEHDIIYRARKRFLQDLRPREGESIQPLDFQRSMDEKVVHLIKEWLSTHKNLQGSRCCAAIIINRSDNPIQILRSDVIVGRNVEIFGVKASAGFDSESRSIMPGGGAAVLFAYGHRPSLIDPAAVTVSMYTSAFTALVSTRKESTTCDAVGGYVVRFLEKSVTELWTKYVILVN